MKEGVASLGAMKARMQWLASRQSLLSGNIANADTPGYKPRDMVPFRVDGTHRTGLARTDPAHLGGGSGSTGSTSTHAARFETRPSGNAVSLEDEMLKVSETQMEHQMLAGLYQRSLGYLKIAIGRKG